MSVEYKWKKIGHLPNDHQKIPPHEAYNELQRIRTTRGALTAGHVVDESEDPSSLFHDVIFYCEDDEAARRHREEVARLLMRSIVVEIRENEDDKPVQTGAFVVVTTTDTAVPSNRVYIPTTEALQNKDTRQEILQHALDDLNKWRRKYAHLQEFSQVVEVIDRLSA